MFVVVVVVVSQHRWRVRKCCAGGSRVFRFMESVVSCGVLAYSTVNDILTLKIVDRQINRVVHVDSAQLLAYKPPKFKRWHHVEQSLCAIALRGVGEGSTVETWCDQLHVAGVLPSLTHDIKTILCSSMEDRWWERPLGKQHHGDDAGDWVDFSASLEFSDEEIARGCGPSTPLTVGRIFYHIWETSVAELDPLENGWADSAQSHQRGARVWPR